MSRPTTAMTPTTDTADVVEIGEVGGDEIGQHGRDRLAGEVGRDELGREERVALTASEDLVDERRHGRRLPISASIFAASSSRPSPSRWMRCAAGRRASSPRRRRCCAARADLVGAVGADQHDVLVDEVAGQEVEQIPRQRVGPVQVLERDDDRTSSPRPRSSSSSGANSMAGCRPLGPPPPRAIQSRSGASVGRVRQRVGLRSPHIAEQVGQRRERDHVAAHRHAPADEQLGTGAPTAFRDQRGLADAGVAADEQRPRARPHGPLPTARSKRQLVVCVRRSRR